MLRLLIPRPWRDVVLRDLEDEARARGKGRMWVAAGLSNPLAEMALRVLLAQRGPQSAQE